MIKSAKTKRTDYSKLLEEVHFYTLDLERITLLRDKAFKAFDSTKGHEEWERYNHILEIMQLTLTRLHEITLKQKPVKK